MQAKELKKYILEDKDRLYTILRNANFHDFRENNEEIRCALPNMDNPTGVMIKLNESLHTSLFELGYTGDLFGALAVVMNYDFKSVMQYVNSLLGLSYNKNIDIIDPLKDLRRLSNASTFSKITENKLYDRSFMNQFVTGTYYSLVEEGISPDVIKEFDIRYDPVRSRIVFPHYDWVHNDKIVGVQGRTTQSPEEMKLLGTAKYWNYIKHFRKNLNLYGYALAKDCIAREKKVVIFEGEKSVLKEFTLNHGKGYSVALGGHAISEQQVKFLLKHTPIDCEIIIAFDKDVMTKEEEGEEYIKAEGEKFKPFREVSYIYDSHNLLKEKDAPIDEGYKVWNYLLKWRKHI